MSDQQALGAIVLTGGDPVTAPVELPDLARFLTDHPLVIAADSGLDQAVRLGLTVDLAVGDFDSASPAAIAGAEESGTRFDRHPEAKDRTDLELALDAAVSAGARRVLVVGGAGGRLDHLVGNLLALASGELGTVEVEARVGAARVTAIRDRTAVLRGEVGELVSLFAVGGPARGVTTVGLHYPLDDDTLLPGSSRGVSNLHTATEAHVTVGDGAVLAIHPGTTNGGGR